MESRPLRVHGAHVVTGPAHVDERGAFAEWFRSDVLAEIDVSIDVRQANLAHSAAGVLRGIHFAEVPPGQAKYFTIVSGRAIDYVVDLRVGSPGYLTWDAVELSGDAPTAVYLAEGLGHAYLALDEGTTACYLVSEPYAPGREHTISAFDPRIGLHLPIPRHAVRMSDRDEAAGDVAAAEEAGVLPDWETCLRWYHEGGKSR